MPIYAYKCKSCGEYFEMVRSIHDKDGKVKCPACAASSPRRVLSGVFSGTSSSSGSGFRLPT